MARQGLMTSAIPTLFDAPEDNHTVAWREFIRKHPFVMSRLIEETEKLVADGHTRVSVKHLFEIIRREVPRDGEPVALNNNFSACAARQIAEERPDLAPLFKMRRRHIA